MGHNISPGRVYLGWLIAVLVVAALASDRLVVAAEGLDHGPRRQVAVEAAHRFDGAMGRLGLDRPGEILVAQRATWSKRLDAAPDVAVRAVAVQVEDIGWALDLPDHGARRALAADLSPAAPAPVRSSPRVSKAPTPDAPGLDQVTPGETASSVTAPDAPLRDESAGDAESVPGAPTPVSDASPKPADDTPAGVEELAATPVVTSRSVNPDAPLRILVVGDSLAQPLGYELLRLGHEAGLMLTEMDFKIASAVARPDYFDWPARFDALLEADVHPGVAERRPTAGPPGRPEAVVMFIGGNENQNMRQGDEVLEIRTEAWRDEYRQRARRMIRSAEAAGVPFYWVGLPAMSDPIRTDIAQEVNAVLAGEAKSRSGFHFVPIWDLFVDDDGQYAAFLPGPDGHPVEMRQSDGVHLSHAGTVSVAERVFDRIAADWAFDLRARGPGPTAVAGPTAVDGSDVTAHEPGLEFSVIGR